MKSVPHMFWSVKDGQLNVERKVRDGGCMSAGTQGVSAIRGCSEPSWKKFAYLNVLSPLQSFQPQPLAISLLNSFDPSFFQHHQAIHALLIEYTHASKISRVQIQTTTVK